MTLGDPFLWFENHPVTSSGIGVFLTFIVSAQFSSIIAILKARRQMVTTTAAMQKILAGGMIERASKTDPSEFWTLEMTYETGQKIFPPLFPGMPMPIGENLTICVSAHCGEMTIATLQCKGIGVLPIHMHANTHESVRVESGTMVNSKTLEAYHAGQVWEIEPGEMHGAIFYDCIASITYRPALKTAAQQPVDLKAMHQIQNVA